MMKLTRNLVPSLFWLFAMAAVIFTLSVPAFAYEEDTHFTVTYVLCRSVGFTPDEASIIAAVDQGMDDSDGTSPMGIVGAPVESQWRWHALDKEGNMYAQGILARRDQLFQDALKETTLRNKLIRLGVFFHYQQDTWAHRHHYDDNHLSRDNYTTYNTPFGHGYDFHQPDRPPFDPVAALMNLEDGIVYARRFLKEGLGREPNPFLVNYVPQGGSQDSGWSGDGNFYHQISLSGAPPNSTRLYLLTLIRTQIDKYASSINPTFGGRYTADEADFESIRRALENVCKQFEPYRAVNIAYPIIDIPTKTQKAAQGFNTLTTAMLDVPLPATPQLIAIGTDQNLRTKTTLGSVWTPARKFAKVSDIAVMRDGTILGVKTDRLLYTRKDLNSDWVQAPKFGQVFSVTVMRDGTILGVGTDGMLYTRANLNSNWVQAPRFREIRSVAAMPDGTILGVGTDRLLYTRANLNSDWVPDTKSGAFTDVAAVQNGTLSRVFIDIAVMQDGTILGVNTNLKLQTRANLNSDWVPAPNPGEIIRVDEMPLAK